MANHIIHTVGRLSDATVIALTEAVHKKMGGNIQRYLYGPVAIQPENIQQIIGERDGYAIDEAAVDTAGAKFQFFYRRGVTGIDRSGNQNINLRIPSPYFDEVIILPNLQTNPTASECLVLETVVSEFTKLHIPQPVASGADDAIKLLQTEIGGLASLHRQMISDANSQRRELEASHQEKLVALENATKQQQEKFAETVAEENSKIAALKAELEAAKKAIDDRDHMHVRRSLRETISQDIRSRVSATLVPRGSQILNWFILGLTLLCSTAAGIFAYVNFESFYQLITPASPYQRSPEATKIPNFDYLAWLLLIRGTFASVVCLAFLIYAIAWMRKTYLDDVKISNELQKYALDINRASWTIETIMEMTQKQGRVLPEKWIEGACYGLFQNQEKDKEKVTPVQALAALLGVSGKAQFGPDGPRFEFTKGQARQIAKGAE